MSLTSEQETLWNLHKSSCFEILFYCVIYFSNFNILGQYSFNGHILIFNDTYYNLVSFDVHIYTCEIIPTTNKIVNTSIIPQSFLVSLFNPFLQTLLPSLHPIWGGINISVTLQTRISSFWHQVANKLHQLQDVAVEQLAKFIPVLKASLPHYIYYVCAIAQTM